MRSERIPIRAHAFDIIWLPQTPARLNLLHIQPLDHHLHSAPFCLPHMSDPGVKTLLVHVFFVFTPDPPHCVEPPAHKPQNLPRRLIRAPPVRICTMQRRHRNTTTTTTPASSARIDVPLDNHKHLCHRHRQWRRWRVHRHLSALHQNCHLLPLGDVAARTVGLKISFREQAGQSTSW